MKSMRTGILCVAVGLMATSGALAQNRVSATKKGSLLIYPKIEIRWQRIGSEWRSVQDTFLELTNDYTGAVYVKMFYVNGDPPLSANAQANERAHRGWNLGGMGRWLTANQPIYWSAATGKPFGLTPFSAALDPGNPPGRPCNDGSGDRVMRGYLIVWAINEASGVEIRWNHLKGGATLVNWVGGSAWEYNAYAFAATETVGHGLPTGTPFVLNLNGAEYDQCFDFLVLDFYRSGSTAVSGPETDVTSDMDITLLPLPVDLRQDSAPPVTTKAKFTIWDSNENLKTGLTRCITCWDQALGSQYAKLNNYFRILETDKGKAVIEGEASTECNVPGRPASVAAPLLGVAAKALSFTVPYPAALAGEPLVGKGYQTARIVYDEQEDNPEMPGGDDPSLGSGDTQGSADEADAQDEELP